jgi:osmotically inducible protein OsmC
MPMAERRAEVVWEGNLTQGKGTITSTGSGAFPAGLPVTWASRVESSDGRTSPEELIAMAHASCYAMALSHTLNEAGSPAERLQVSSVVTVEQVPGGIKVGESRLEVRGKVPGLDQARFEEMARKGEQGCPISNALRNNVQINLTATLEQ